MPESGELSPLKTLLSSPSNNLKPHCFLPVNINHSQNPIVISFFFPINLPPPKINQQPFCSIFFSLTTTSNTKTTPADHRKPPKSPSKNTTWNNHQKTPRTPPKTTIKALPKLRLVTPKTTHETTLFTASKRVKSHTTTPVFPLVCCNQQLSRGAQSFDEPKQRKKNTPPVPLLLLLHDLFSIFVGTSTRTTNRSPHLWRARNHAGVTMGNNNKSPWNNQIQPGNLHFRWPSSFSHFLYFCLGWICYCFVRYYLYCCHLANLILFLASSSTFFYYYYYVSGKVLIINLMACSLFVLFDALVNIDWGW